MKRMSRCSCYLVAVGLVVPLLMFSGALAEDPDPASERAAHHRRVVEIGRSTGLVFVLFSGSRPSDRAAMG